MQVSGGSLSGSPSLLSIVVMMIVIINRYFEDFAKT